MSATLTKAEENEISEVLASLRLNANEQRVFLSSLSLGATTLSPLAKAAGLPLTTAQSIADRLVAEGLLGEGKTKSRRIYTASSPKQLAAIAAARAEEVAHVVPLLERFIGTGSKPKISVYQDERTTDIFLEALACKSKQVYEIVSAKDIQDVLGEKFHFSKRRIEKNVRLKSLRVESREVKAYSPRIHAKELREARFLPKELSFQMSVMVWDDTVAFFSSKAEGLAWTVQSKVVATSIKQVFDFLWQLSRPMVTLKE